MVRPDSYARCRSAYARLRRFRVAAALTVIVAAFEPRAAGTDGAPHTLEDLYGPTGNRFQAAITFNNLGPTPTTFPGTSFGLAIDDMFVEWKEVSLGPDETDCALGQCAAIELPAGIVYASVASIVGRSSTPRPTAARARAALPTAPCAFRSTATTTAPAARASRR